MACTGTSSCNRSKRSPLLITETNHCTTSPSPRVILDPGIGSIVADCVAIAAAFTSPALPLQVSGWNRGGRGWHHRSRRGSRGGTTGGGKDGRLSTLLPPHPLPSCCQGGFSMTTVASPHHASLCKAAAPSHIHRHTCISRSPLPPRSLDDGGEPSQMHIHI